MIEKIAAAMVAAQKGFAPALKCATNPHFKSRYADLAAVVEAVIDSLNNNGIMLMQKTHDAHNGVIVETTFLHESGEVMDAGRLFVPAAKLDPQGFGSALTYARRYSLMAACGIAPEDDDGNAATKPYNAAKTQPAQPKRQERITTAQFETLNALADECGADKAAFCKAIGVGSMAEITQDRYELAASKLQAKIDKMKGEA